MASITSKPLFYKAYRGGVSSWFTMDGSGVKMGYKFKPYKTVAESDISFYVSEALSPPSYKIGIQADSGGSPSGTFLTSVNASGLVTGWNTVTLGSAFTYTSGTTYWLVIQYNSGTIGASDYIKLSVLSYQNADTETRWPSNLSEGSLQVKFTNGSGWTAYASIPTFMIGTTLGQPYARIGNYAPIESLYVGQQVKFPYDKTVNGFAFMVYKVGNPTSSLVYDVRDSTNTIIQSGTLTTATGLSTDSQNPTKVSAQFSPITMTAGQYYRLTVHSTLYDSFSNTYVIKALYVEVGGPTTATYNEDTDVRAISSTDSGSTWGTTNVYDYIFDIHSTHYWVGGDGDWDDPDNWADTSGGTGGVGVPSEYSPVVIDSSSGSNFTISLNQNTTVGSLTETSSTGVVLQTNSYTLNVNGSLSIDTLDIQNDNTARYSVSLNSTGTLDMGSAELGVGINIAGTYTLASDITSDYDRFPLLKVSSGSFDTANYDLDLQKISSSTTSAKTITLGTSNIYLSAAGDTSGGWDMSASTGLTLSAASSNITLNVDGIYAMALVFSGGGKTYGTVSVIGDNTQTPTGATVTFSGNNTINSLVLDATGTVLNYKLTSGSTNTLTSLSGLGDPTNKSVMTATSTGSFTLSKSSGTVVLQNFNISKSTATGGAGFYAVSSTNSGSNSGWTFGSPAYERNEGTIQTGTGVATLTLETASIDEGSSNSGFGVGTYSTIYQALPQKDYELRVSDPDGNFVAIWKNVVSEFGYQQSINQNAGELIVEIARNPENRVVSTEQLLDESSDPILDENSDPILVQTETANSVGPGTDIQENYNVEVYAFYGGYEPLRDEFGDDILDENNSVILVQYGSPNGKRVYAGYIAEYDMNFGERSGVIVTVVPHATEMSHYIFTDGSGNTTVEYNSVDPVTMARDAMDDYTAQGGIVTYDEQSMSLSGQVSSYDFKLQRVREAIDKTVELLPSGYYHFVDPGEIKQYLLPKAETAHHTFYYEKHISSLRLKKSITQLINKVYYIGGDTGTEDLFSYVEDSTSIADYRPGLDIQSDSRVTLLTSAQALSQRLINEYKEPRYRTTVTITDVVYDIESIKLGHMVSFGNFASYVDDLLLQIVSLTRSKHSVTLDLDMIVPNDTKRLEEIKRNLLSEVVSNIGDTPS